MNKELIQIRDDDNNTLLHVAVDEELKELVLYLLLKKVNPNVKNSDGDTCLHLAMRKGNIPITALLVEHGTSLYVKNNKKEIPYDYATVI